MAFDQPATLRKLENTHKNITLFVTLFVTRKLENTPRDKKRDEKRDIFSRYFFERDEKRDEKREIFLNHALSFSRCTYAQALAWSAAVC